jgi:hypothetical protein
MQILIIPIILFNFKNQSNGVKSDWFLLVVYALAKVFEYFGTQVFNLLGIKGKFHLSNKALVLTQIGQVLVE